MITPVAVQIPLKATKNRFAIAKLDDAVADSPVKVTFNGTTVTATEPKLATAVYNYTGDPTIDPTAEDEYYYANIVLTVATV